MNKTINFEGMSRAEALQAVNDLYDKNWLEDYADLWESKRKGDGIFLKNVATNTAKEFMKRLGTHVNTDNEDDFITVGGIEGIFDEMGIDLEEKVYEFPPDVFIPEPFMRFPDDKPAL